MAIILLSEDLIINHACPYPTKAAGDAYNRSHHALMESHEGDIISLNNYPGNAFTLAIWNQWSESNMDLIYVRSINANSHPFNRGRPPGLD